VSARLRADRRIVRKTTRRCQPVQESDRPGDRSDRRLPSSGIEAPRVEDRVFRLATAGGIGAQGTDWSPRGPAPPREACVPQHGWCHVAARQRAAAWLRPGVLGRRGWSASTGPTLAHRGREADAMADCLTGDAATPFGCSVEVTRMLDLPAPHVHVGRSSQTAGRRGERSSSPGCLTVAHHGGAMSSAVKHVGQSCCAADTALDLAPQRRSSLCTCHDVG
jgi:hypothetical protein